MLSNADVEVRRRIYDGVMTAGRIPLRAELARDLAVDPQAVSQSLARLADAHQIVLQRDNGEVLMANPFSAIPTPFVVRIGARSWYANCIWDGMGLVAMMSADDAAIETACGCCGSATTILVPAECRDDDERLVHFAIPAARWWDDIVFN